MAQAQARYEDASIMSVDPNMVQTQQKLKGLGTTRPSFNTPFKLNLGGVQGALTTENPVATIEPGKKPQINRQLVKPTQEAAVATEQTSVPTTDSASALVVDLGENGDITAEEIQQYYPEFIGKEDVIAALALDLQENGDISEEELAQYYPELISGAAPEVSTTQSIKDKIDSIDIPNVVPFQDVFEKGLKSGAKGLVDVGGDIAAAAKERGDNVLGMQERSGYNPALEAAGIAGQGFGFAGDVIGAFLKEGAKAADKLVGGAGTKTLQGIASTKEGKAGLEALQKGAVAYNEWADKHPKAAVAVEALGNVGDFALNFVGGKLVEQGGKQLATKGAEAAFEGASAIEKGLKGAKISTRNIAQEVAPLAGKNVSRAAVEEGRVAERSAVTDWLFGKKVNPSDKVQEAAAVIREDIPNFSKDPVKQYSQLDTTIDQIGSTVDNDLAKIPTKPFQDRLNKFVLQVKDRLLNKTATEDFLTSGQTKKIQAVIDDIGEAKNGKEVRQIRINYDRSIPESVKNAHSGSAPKLLQMKQEWLETRSMLNDVMEDMARQTDSPSVKTAFRKMHVLFEAQDNVLEKAIESLNKEPFFNKDNLIKGAVGAAVPTTLYGGYKALGG